MRDHSLPPDDTSDGNLRLLIDNLPRSFLYQYTYRPDGSRQFLYLSEGVSAVYGLTIDEINANPNLLPALTDPAFRGKVSRAEAKALAQNSEMSLKLRIRHPDGHWRWLELRARHHQRPSGQIVWDGLATDITASHEQQIPLWQLKQRTEMLLTLSQLEEPYEEHKFMQQVLNMVEKLTNSEIGFMHFVNDDHESIEQITWSSNTLNNDCHTAFDCHHPISEAGIWADAARQKVPLIINDYANGRNKKGLPEGHCTLRRLVSVPVLNKGEVCMMTGVGNKPTAYNDLDIETLQLIGNETWRIIAKKRAEKALRIASQVVNASPVVCFRWRAQENWPVEFVSENITQWGYSTEEIHAGTPTFAEMVHPDDLPRVSAEVSSHTANGLTSFIQEYRLLTRQGEIIWIEDRTIVQRDTDGTVLFYDGVLTDITERRLRQESMDKAIAEQRVLNKRLAEAHNQLLQSEKMASIGQLAAGVAHELNNPIGFVHSNMGSLEGYLRDLMDIIDCYDECTNSLPPDAPTRQKIDRLREERDFNYLREDIFNLLGESKDGLSRVRKIIQDLRSFSHVGEQEWQPANLHAGLDSTLNIVWNELKYKCKVIKEYSDLPKVFCLISQLNQVFMNLLVNAGQAIETHGEITLRTALHGTDSVKIEICDTGKGIAPEHLNRIFEPFFTTKPIGKGTGLGLSLSYSIIEHHHGRIEVDSKVDRGTCFRIIIPIEQPRTEAARQPATTEPTS